jgi:hypothetical protein
MTGWPTFWIGGFAVIQHGDARTTKDIDLLVGSSTAGLHHGRRGSPKGLRYV